MSADGFWTPRRTAFGFALFAFLCVLLTLGDPGITVDELDLPTTDGLIKFHNVPIAVLDVTVSDGTTSYTLDGDFGMNLLLPSMDTTAGNTTGGAFDFFSFDEATGLLSLTDSTVVPEPAAMGLMVLAGVLTCRRRRQMPRD